MRNFFSKLPEIIQEKIFIKFFGYNPKRFWNLKAESFLHDDWQVKIYPQHAWVLKKIKKSEPNKILEIGCGFGRNIKFLINNGIDSDRITGIDISRKMIKNAQEFIANPGVKLLVCDANNLPFRDKMFDLSLIHGVFMHVGPNRIKYVLKEVIRVTKNYILDIEQNYLPNEKNNNVRKYTFLHNYASLYKELGCSVLEEVDDKNLGLNYFYVKVR